MPRFVKRTMCNVTIVDKVKTRIQTFREHSFHHVRMLTESLDTSELCVFTLSTLRVLRLHKSGHIVLTYNHSRALQYESIHAYAMFQGQNWNWVKRIGSEMIGYFFFTSLDKAGQNC